MKLSSEQINIINNISDFNLIVDARSGSGKSSTMISAAEKNPHRKFLLITYNSKLRLETKERLEMRKIHNMEVHTYHSFAVKFFSPIIINDYNMIAAMEREFKPQRDFSYDNLIFDEAQDITPIYFKLICYIIKFNKISNYRLTIIGDKFQNIYQFNNADNRYISLASNVFSFNKNAWKSLDLSETFRCTKPICNFINSIIGHTRIISNKNGPKVIYIKTNAFKFGETTIKKYFEDGYKPKDIFILAPSVRNENSPVRQLANKLSQSGISIYVPNSDEEKLDISVLENKLVFTTFHQSKGLERPIVFVFGFDNSYLNLYAKCESPKYFPNTLYVACTRALMHLVVVHHEANKHLPYINNNVLSQCTVYGHNIFEVEDGTEKRETLNFSVTNLIRHLSSEVLYDAMKFIEVKTLYKKGVKVDNEKQEYVWEDDIPKNTQLAGIVHDSTAETVSEINGIAIPAYFEFKRLGKISFATRLQGENIKNRGKLSNAIESYKQFTISLLSSHTTKTNEEGLLNFRELVLDEIGENEIIEYALNIEPINENNIDNIDNVDEDNEDDIINSDLNDFELNDSSDINNKDNILSVIDNDYYELIEKINKIKLHTADELFEENNIDVDDELKDSSTLDNKNLDNKNLNNEFTKSLMEFKIKNILPNQLAELATIWNAEKTGYLFKLLQIKRFDWIKQKQLDECIKRLNKHITSEDKLSMEVYIETRLNKYQVNGYIDCITENETEIKIWEFKCVGRLEKEHILQLAIYAFCYITQKPAYKAGDFVEIMLDKSEVVEILEVNIKFKYTCPTMKIACCKVKNSCGEIYEIEETHILKKIQEAAPTHKQIKFCLFNILDGTLIQLIPQKEILGALAMFLIYSKTIPQKRISDEEFLDMNHKIYMEATYENKTEQKNKPNI